MRKPIAILAVAAVHFSMAQLMATVIPPIGLAPGTPYQLVFVTKDLITATSSNIDDYNAFVAAEAALNPSLPAVTWRAVATTATVDAAVNAPSGGLPVYNTAGIEVATAATGLYNTANLLHPISRDQFGNVGPDFTWTGDYHAARSTSAFALGNGGFGAILGRSVATTIAWTTYGLNDLSATYGMYALSEPMTMPSPEPATLTLLGSALLIMGVARFARWRRQP